MYQENTTERDPSAYRSPVLVAAAAGRMRNSLRFLLRTVPGIQIVGCADDSASALSLASDLRPALVLLDTNLPGEDTATVLQRIKDDASQGQPRCLVLVDTRQQQRDAIAAGADVALLKGYPTTKLFEEIQTLTAQRETHGELASRTIDT